MPKTKLKKKKSGRERERIDIFEIKGNCQLEKGKGNEMSRRKRDETEMRKKAFKSYLC